MRFDVGLVDQIQAVLITQIVPLRIVRIVAGPHGVQIKLLHYLDIADHRLDRDRVAGHRFVLVPVGTFQVDPLAVDPQIAVLHFNSAKTHFAGRHFDDAAVRVLQRQQQPVKIGLFGGPFGRIGNCFG